MGVNHDPNSVVSLHKKTGSPVQTSLSLTFKEIELPVSEDEGMDISGKIEEHAIQQTGGTGPPTVLSMQGIQDPSTSTIEQ